MRGKAREAARRRRERSRLMSGVLKGGAMNDHGAFEQDAMEQLMEEGYREMNEFNQGEAEEFLPLVIEAVGASAETTDE